MYNFFFKRFIDIILSSLAIVFLSPLLIPVVIALLLTGENYIFYFQERIGFKNKKFKIIKFATMIKNSPSVGTGLHTKKNDPRILPFGGFLRKTKINELPQLFNILFGSMSIVGPRPLVDKTFEPYSDEVKNSIYNVKPGLTGIGSIVFRDEEELLSKTNLPLDEYYEKFISPYKGELELWYQKNISFYTDFLIIMITAFTIFFPNNNLVSLFFKDLPKNKIK
jgi:lipopolysaccharide/colanic/teichoic acid biosynthesis glycosyltransferase